MINGYGPNFKMGTEAAVIGGGAILGGIVGGQGKSTSISTNVAPASQEEIAARGIGLGGLEQLQQFGQVGTNQQDVLSSFKAQRSLAERLEELSRTGGLPTGEQVNLSNQAAQRLFAPQQTQLEQAFQQQSIQARREAARLGRSVADPILQARLRTSQAQQQAQLSARQGALGQQLALQLPGQQLGFAQQRVGVLGDIAGQGIDLQSRLAQLGFGSAGQLASFRAQTAGRTQSTPGNFLAGALSGAGLGLGFAGGINQLGGFGGGGFSTSPGTQIDARA